MPNPKLSIVIPVWNNYHFTNLTLLDLLHLPEDHHLIVVDNGSSDGTRNLLPANRLDVIRLVENLGFAGACNIGFQKAQELGSENILFLNNDIRVRSNLKLWTQPLIEAAQRGVIAGPTVGCLDRNLNFRCEASKWPSTGYSYISGWCIAASLETWQNLIVRDTSSGPFSEEFGLVYFEDTDLGFKAREQNIPMEIVDVPVSHYGKATSKKIGISRLYVPAKEKFIKKWKGRVSE